MRRDLLAASMACAALASVTVVCAQQAEFKIPEGWVVSPENTKAPGEAGYRIERVRGPAGLDLLYVPAGKFTMGLTDDEFAEIRKSYRGGPDLAMGPHGCYVAEQWEHHLDEVPAHEVELSAYWIGRTEVTVGQWRKVIGSVPENPLSYPVNDQGDDYPVVWVRWDECREFCQMLGLRLPTEAEWEQVARGPKRRTWPWGNKWDKKKCCNGNNRGPNGGTLPVGSLPAGASWCRALDMAGNVWELCSDWWDEDYYAESPKVNPTGPSDGTWQALRGGSFNNLIDPMYFRCVHRALQNPSRRSRGIGFRCARDA